MYTESWQQRGTLILILGCVLDKKTSNLTINCGSISAGLQITAGHRTMSVQNLPTSDEICHRTIFFIINDFI